MTGSDRLPWYATWLPADYGRVEDIRDRLWDELWAPEGYEKVRPHLTVHPGFSVDNETASRIAGRLVYAVGEAVRVTGVEYYPGPDEPAVVMLGCETDNIGWWRDSIEDAIEDAGGTIDTEPVPAHMTLFKRADRPDDDEDTAERWADWHEHRATAMGKPNALLEAEGAEWGWETTVRGSELVCRSPPER